MTRPKPVIFGSRCRHRMMSHQAVSGLKVPQCSGGLQISRERSSAGAMAKSRIVCRSRNGGRASVSNRVTSFGGPRTLLVRAQFRKTGCAPAAEVGAALQRIEAKNLSENLQTRTRRDKVKGTKILHNTEGVAHQYVERPSRGKAPALMSACNAADQSRICDQRNGPHAHFCSAAGKMRLCLR